MSSAHYPATALVYAVPVSVVGEDLIVGVIAILSRWAAVTVRVLAGHGRVPVVAILDSKDPVAVTIIIGVRGRCVAIIAIPLTGAQPIAICIRRIQGGIRVIAIPLVLAIAVSVVVNGVRVVI